MNTLIQFATEAYRMYLFSFRLAYVRQQFVHLFLYLNRDLLEIRSLLDGQVIVIIL